MAFSIAGVVSVLCRLTNSWTSFAPNSARVLVRLSSNADFTALAFRVASFSIAANWVAASERIVSTLALPAAWICSGVTYMV
jgi:hypothetical protein